MRATVCQIPNHGAEEREAAYAALFEHARAEKSDLVVIPEMGLSDWLSNEPEADPARWDAAVQAHETAIAGWGELPFAVIGSRPAVRDGRRLNEGFALEAGRARPAHYKRYLPEEPGYWEARWYEPGSGAFETFEAAGVRAGMMICSDLWFFEHARELGRAGAAAICHPRATEAATVDRWRTGVRAAAIVSGAYVLSSNLWEPAGARSDADLGGAGVIAAPDGTLLGETDEAAPFLTVDIDPGAAAKAKTLYPRYIR